MDRAFYYDINSPYAYLAAHRVDELLPGIEWSPIAFGPLLVKTQRIPWSIESEESREAGKREIERRAAERGLPPIVWPEGWPAESYTVNAARAALLAAKQGRIRELSLALYEQLFVFGRRLDEPGGIEAAAEEVGIEGIREAIADPAIKDELRERTDAAIERGVVGIPTVAVGDRLFWGDDKLEDAAAA